LNNTPTSLGSAELAISWAISRASLHWVSYFDLIIVINDCVSKPIASLYYQISYSLPFLASAKYYLLISTEYLRLLFPKLIINCTYNIWTEYNINKINKATQQLLFVIRLTCPSINFRCISAQYNHYRDMSSHVQQLE
jgi:hypothetical protein